VVVIEPDTDAVNVPAIVESGRICAVAVQAYRELMEWTAQYKNVFSGGPFDSSLFNAVCLCTAFSAPWAKSAELRMANRSAVWGFVPDWLIDYVATSRSEVDDVVGRCLAVADGDQPAADDDLARSLADIRDELATSRAFPPLRDAWVDDLRRYLLGMAREWDWKEARTSGVTDGPTFAEYLQNADNFGFSFPFVSHWIYTTPLPVTNIEAIRQASWATQRAMRLVNDLGTYQRDLKWGDLNGLMLGITPEEMHTHIAELTAQFRDIARPLRADHPRLISYLERQRDFCIGFYQAADYWGAI
jgi:hypothetical protein